MNHNYSAKYKNVVIRPLNAMDIENLRNWRNDSSQTKFLRQVDYITPEMQLEWYNKYLQDPLEIKFAIDEISELNRMIGSIAIYDIDNDNRIAEIGKIQIGDTAAHGKGIGKYILVMAMKIAFNELNMCKIISKVSPYNIPAYTNDMKVGFRVVGSHTTDTGIVEDDIELTENELKKANVYYNQIELNQFDNTQLLL